VRAQTETVTYIHSDLFGSPLAGTGAAAELLWKENFQPYGDRWGIGAGGDNNVRFHGKPRRDPRLCRQRAPPDALASALRHHAEVTDGAMMREISIPNEISLEEMARNHLVGDCETIAKRLCDEIRAARSSHVMFHFQVGGSSHARALHTMEKPMGEIVPMVERELGPLASLGAPTRAAAVTQ
jgi:hypothetical protein